MTIFTISCVIKSSQYDVIEWKIKKRQLSLHRVAIVYPASLASAIGYSCKRFPRFRQSFVKYIENFAAKEPICAIDITLLEVRTDFNRKWDEIVAITALKRYQLDDAMNWLNTLGGGYSALGDYFSSFARKAGEISLYQLKVALLLGDEVVKCRCYLYMAQSFMQRGLLRRSKLLLRKQYEIAIKLKDDKLLAVCQGLWSRLQYLYECNKQH
ncbi:unnamed protein product [Dimorphilus gyrociliatus]|uniref:Uncharacterized protein n=1 Tax=Dimorphilus gyrociliatus TaxID=2664684 RepID=A0A7I8VJF9_9ANNE|nr:unnamed protein product [Dimorphilus gyrociliatus]